MTDITAVADGYLRALATLDPEAPRRPDVRRSGGWPTCRRTASTPAPTLARATATAVAAATVTVPAERALAGALADRLASEVALHEAGFTTRLLAPLATPVHLARQVFDNLPRTTVDDWAVVAEHLHRLPTTLDQYAATLRRSAGRGQLVARRQVLTVADQCAAWVDADFFGDLVAGHRSEPLAPGGTAATAKFATFLRTDLAPAATEVDGVGRDLYQVTARAFLGATVDLDELYAYGWAELSRTAAELRAAAADCGHPDVAAARTALDADPDGGCRSVPPLRSG